jgi:hypothetical protein
VDDHWSNITQNLSESSKSTVSHQESRCENAKWNISALRIWPLVLENISVDLPKGTAQQGVYWDFSVAEGGKTPGSILAKFVRGREDLSEGACESDESEACQDWDLINLENAPPLN